MKMFASMKKVSALSLAALLLVSSLTGCGSAKATPKGNTQQASSSGNTPAGKSKADTSKEVNLSMYLWGSASVDNAFVMETLNKRLKEKINATLEIKYIPWDAIATKYPLIFASGEAYDLVYTSITANPTYFSLAEKKAFQPLDELLPVYAPETWKKTPQDLWADAKFNGKIYGIPSRYTEYIPGGLVYRGDLLKKYGMQPLASLGDVQTYFENILKNEKGMTPWMANSSKAADLYGMFVDFTGTWLKVPSVDISTMYLAANSKDDIKNVFHPAFTNEFLQFAKRMKEWSDKGFWTKDVLSTKNDPSTEFNSGKGAAYFHHAQGFVGWYGNLLQAQPNSDPQFFTFGDATKKVVKTRTMQNATAFSANSKNVERSLMLVDLLMNNKEFYDLFHFGIEGRNYALNGDGKRVNPANFDAKKNGYGQSGWNLRTDELEIQVATDYPERKSMNKQYDAFSIKDPFSNFNFDSKNVASELAAVNQVNSQIGVQILFGKAGDPEAAVESYRSKLKAAGIEKIIAEVKKQIENYQPVK